MKTLTKIVILLLAIMAVVGGVLWYAKTQLESPMAETSHEANYENVIEGAIGEMKGKDRDTQREDMERLITKCYVFYDLGKISDRLYGQYTDQIWNIYAGTYITYAEQELDKQESWNELKLTRIYKDSKSLKDWSESIGMNQNQNLSKINRLMGVRGMYNDARKYADIDGWKSLFESEMIMNKVRKYQNDTYLRKNTDLQSRLSKVGKRLSRNYYKSLDNRVSNMENTYSEISESRFNTQKGQIDRSMKGYGKSAKGIYGYIDVSYQKLNERWNSCKEKAEKHHNSCKEEAKKYHNPYKEGTVKYYRQQRRISLKKRILKIRYAYLGYHGMSESTFNTQKEQIDSDMKEYRCLYGIDDHYKELEKIWNSCKEETAKYYREQRWKNRRY